MSAPLRICNLATQATSAPAADLLPLDNNAYATTKRITVSALIGSRVLAGSTLIVDAINGNDATAARGSFTKSYLTPEAAQTAASSGDTVHVYPGSYTISAYLGKNGVNWNLEPGVTLTATCDSGANRQVFSDNNTAMTFVVAGAGNLICDGSATPGGSFNATVMVQNSSSDIRIQANRIAYLPPSDDTPGAAIYQAGGRLSVSADLIDVDPGSLAYGIWWVNGSGFIRTNKLLAGYAAVYAAVITSPTGDWTVVADIIQSLSYQCVWNVSTQAEAKLWVTVNGLMDALLQGILVTGGKSYITAQKIAGMVLDTTATSGVVECDGGSLWLNVQKITGTQVSGIYVSAGTANIDVMQIENLSAQTHGLTHAGGVTRLHNAYIATANSANNFPVQVSSTGLTLTGCTLVAPATCSFTINSSGSQNVALAGCIGNKTTNGITAIPNVLPFNTGVI